MSLPSGLLRIAAMLSLLLLAGCFRPMYGTLQGQPSTLDALAQVDVAPIEGRVGQKVRNELLYAFSGGEAERAPYKLAITLIGDEDDLFLRRTTEARASVYELRANYTLIDVTSGTVINGGSSLARASYDRSTQIFANERALIDAENRAAKAVAADLKTRIAAFFAARQPR